MVLAPCACRLPSSPERGLRLAHPLGVLISAELPHPQAEIHWVSKQVFFRQFGSSRSRHMYALRAPPARSIATHRELSRPIASYRDPSRAIAKNRIRICVY